MPALRQFRRPHLLSLLLGLPLAALPLSGAPSAPAAVAADKPYLLHYDKPAPLDLKGWEFYSMPLGNGYFGVSVFGGVADELWQFRPISKAHGI